MAGDEERLIVLVEARIRDLEKNMAKASGTTGREFGKMRRDSKSATAAMEQDVVRSTSRINQALAAGSSRIGAFGKSFVALGRSVGGIFAGALALKGAQSFIDNSIKITNALKATGLEGEALTGVYDDLFASAQRNSAPLESLVKLYSSVALNMKELNTNSGELVGFTDTVAMALRAGGTSASEASGALLQLSQSLGSGVVRAEEFNSILEGAPVIAQAAAAGIKEAGGSVAELRKLMLAGQISSEAFFRGIQAGSPLIAERLESAEKTISGSFQNLFNSLTKAAGEFNTSSQAANVFGKAIDNLAIYIDGVSFDSLIGEVQGYIDIINNALNSTNDFILNLSRISGLRNVGDYISSTAIGQALGVQNPVTRQERIKGEAYGTDPALAAYIKKTYPGAGKSDRLDPPKPASFTPISIADYAPKATASGAGKKSGGGGGRDASAAKAEREAAAVKDLIDDLDREKSLIGATDVEREISNALRQAGASATDEQKQRITDLVTAIDAETKALENQKEAQEALKGVASDVLHTIADGIREGASAGEILGNVLDDLASKLIDMAINNLVENAFGGASGGGGGFLSSIASAIGSAFGLGGGGDAWAGLRTVTAATGGSITGPGTGTSDSIPAMLSDGEFVVNARSAKRHRDLLEGINSGKLLHLAAGGPVSVSAPSMPAMPSAGASAPRSQAGRTTFVLNDMRSADSPPIEQRETTDANGDKKVEVWVRGMVRDEAGPTGKTGRMNRDLYGQKPAVLRR